METGWARSEIVTLAVAILVVSAFAIAVTVTVDGVGTVAGAVYRPEVEIVPKVVLPPVIPLTCHVTPVLVVLVTVAINCCVVLTCIVTVAGTTVIVTGSPDKTVTVALAVFVVSAFAIAVTVTGLVLGTVAGAV
jgi:hypothetical protein